MVWCGRRRRARWRLLVDRTDRPARPGGRSSRHAAAPRRHLDAGEPLVRPLLRVRAVDRPVGSAAGYTPARRAGGDRSRRTASQSLETPDVPHSWGAIHEPVERRRHGRLLHQRRDLGPRLLHRRRAAVLLRALHETSTLAVNFFCSQLGPTWPNRFYHMAGTSGGITTNGVWGYGIFDYPMILDLLDAAGVTWKIYSLGMDSVPYGNTDNVSVFWKNFVHDQRTLGSKGGYPQRHPQGSPAAGVVRDPELRPRLGRAPAGGRVDRDGSPGGADHARFAIRRPGRAPPTSSRTTSTAGTSTTFPRRSSMRSGSASGSRPGSSRRGRRRAISTRRCTRSRRSSSSSSGSTGCRRWPRSTTASTRRPRRAVTTRRPVRTVGPPAPPRDDRARSATCSTRSRSDAVDFGPRIQNGRATPTPGRTGSPLSAG